MEAYTMPEIDVETVNVVAMLQPAFASASDALTFIEESGDLIIRNEEFRGQVANKLRANNPQLAVDGLRIVNRGIQAQIAWKLCLAVHMHPKRSQEISGAIRAGKMDSYWETITSFPTVFAGALDEDRQYRKVFAEFSEMAKEGSFMEDFDRHLVDTKGEEFDVSWMADTVSKLLGGKRMPLKALQAVTKHMRFRYRGYFGLSGSRGPSVKKALPAKERARKAAKSEKDRAIRAARKSPKRG